jgi:hypothetical protein
MVGITQPIKHTTRNRPVKQKPVRRRFKSCPPDHSRMPFYDERKNPEQKELKVHYGKGTEQIICSKVVQVYRSMNSEGIQNGTWSCSEKNLSSNYAVVWKICMKIGIGYWASK